MKTVLKVCLVVVLLLSFAAVIPTNAQDDAVVIVGVNAEFPPFESIDADGNIVGFDIDLMDAIAADAGFEVEYVNTRWDGIFVALKEGEFDVVISAATITEEREKDVDFSDPYFNAGQNITVTADLAEDVAGPEDLAGLRVGVQLGTTGDEYASGLEGVEVVRFDEATFAFQALGAGEVEAVIVDAPVSIDILANNPDINGVIVGEPLTDEFYGIAVNPERTDLLDAVNVSLANLIADGTYAEIYEEWFAQTPPAAFMGEAVEGDAEGSAAIDMTTPEGTVMGILGTFFAAEDASDLLPFACEGGTDSPLFPDNETLAGFAGMELADASNLVLEAEIDGNVAIVKPTATSTVILKIGEAEQELPISLLLTQLGIESIRLEQNEEGIWLICPEAE
jgi:polar amino acid transport system substrate-binding protein